LIIFNYTKEKPLYYILSQSIKDMKSYEEYAKEQKRLADPATHNLIKAKKSDIKQGAELVWFYPSSKINLEVKLLEVTKSKRVLIEKKNKKGKYIEGGYINIDELYVKTK